MILDSSAAVDETVSDRHNGFKVLRNGLKRSGISAVPDVHTYHATETSVTLEGIDNVEDFVEKLDRIEPPGQMISFLIDPLMQKYVELRPSTLSSTRIDLWLSTCLEGLYEAARQGMDDSVSPKDIINCLRLHVAYKKASHSSL